MAERKITVTEGDKKIYEGPENRHAHNVAFVQMPRLLGLSPDTWIKVAGFIIAVTLFYSRTDDFMKSQTVTNAYIMAFARNSDAYHSAITGQQFEQGQPNGRNISSGRRNFNITSTAYAAEKQEER